MYIYYFHGRWKCYPDLDFDPGPSALIFFEGVDFLKIKDLLENKRVDQ